MLLRISRFVHLLPIEVDRVLIVDAISHVRFVVNRELADLIATFRKPTEVSDKVASEGIVPALLERGVLTDKDPQEEFHHIIGVLKPYHGRDPIELLDRFRRSRREGVDPYFAASVARSADDFIGERRKIEILLFGDCDLQIEADFLRREALSSGIDLRIAASFPSDLRLASEHKHDAIVIGALAARYSIADSENALPFSLFIEESRKTLAGLRQWSSKPILIDNLPEPTVQPLGMAERGPGGHRNRFRAANIALAGLAEEFSDVHVVDIAATLGLVGAERLLDDGLVDFSHFGSPGWMLQRPQDEKTAVHGIFPDISPLLKWLDDDPYLREKYTAHAHFCALSTVLGLDQKKCVIVDLDGLLWPGAVAETGAPFAWSEDVSGPYSYIGLYFGLHEALLALKRRGILLACVSKNDETTVRELWKYEPHYSKLKLLTIDDFAALRINWNSKVDNIIAISEELGFDLQSFVFLDDSPVERERVRQHLPVVEVWGGNPFNLRRRLLNDARLQRTRVTPEAAKRTELTRAQANRQSKRKDLGEEDFIASLDIECRFERLRHGANVDRVAELLDRTTQFNTTGAKFTVAELELLLRDPIVSIFMMYVKDRFGDHGLVGAAVILDSEIMSLVVSCRVLGINIEHRFLKHIIASLRGDHKWLCGRIVETSRNIPVRNLYRDNGFSLEDNTWKLRLN